MAPQPSPYGPLINPNNGIDPMIQQQMLEFAMGGASPFMSPQDMSPYPFIMGPEDEDELGTLDYQNDRFTAIKKANDISADPAWLVNQGATLAGYQPEAYGYQTQYQPVKANGYMRAQQLMQTGDPLSQYIAMRALANASPLAIRQEIMTMLNDPLDDEQRALGEQLREFIPQANFQGRPQGEGTYDFELIDSTINAITAPLAEDDPRWDRQTFDENGIPALAYEAPTEAQQALERLGYTHNPYETFDPWMFAPEGETPEAMAMARIQGSTAAGEYNDAIKNSGAQNRAYAQFMMNDRDPETRAWRERGVNNAAPAAAPIAAPQAQPSGSTRGMGSLAASEGSGPAMPGWLSTMFSGSDASPRRARGSRNLAQPQQAAMAQSYLMGEPPNQTPGGRPANVQRAMSAMDQKLRDEARRKFEEANRNSIRATGNMREMGARDFAARNAHSNRQNYVGQLAAQGFTPFEMQRRAMMQNIWGI